MIFEKLIIATGNKNKYNEFVYIINNLAGEDFAGGIIFAPELAEIKVQETGESYSENAILKARTWSKISGLPCLADDSGLEVKALDGAPGLYSSRIISGSDEERVKWLLENLKDKKDRNARFFAAVAISVPEEYTIVCEGECKGKISFSPAGKNGFGYDPVFIPDGFENSFAQIPSEQKNLISHRADAFRKIYLLEKYML